MVGLDKQPQQNIYYAVQQTEQQAPPTPGDQGAASTFIQDLRHGVVNAVGHR
jgi:hypothetical protein